jgi:hypothetical protein
MEQESKMSQEHAPKHEHHGGSHEHVRHSHEMHKAHERLKAAAEEAKGKSIEKEITEARQAVRAEASHAERPAPHQEKDTFVPSRTKVDKENAFKAIMHHTRNGLKKPERTFSLIIHQPVVEKVSEVAGKTIARPSGIMGATVAAFIGLLSVYGIARFIGFPLSGSEMPLLLAIGFGVGLFLEWAVKATRSLFSPATE